MAEFKIWAGCFLWRQVRDAVREAKFRGMDISMFESSGWFERRFVFRGPPDDVRRFKTAIDNWIAKVNDDDPKIVASQLRRNVTSSDRP